MACKVFKESRNAMSISSVIIRMEIAATGECCNRVTQNSSFWDVHQLVWFLLHEERSSVRLHRKSLFHYKSRIPQKRVFRKKLQTIVVIKCLYIFSHEWDFLLQWPYILGEIMKSIKAHFKHTMYCGAQISEIVPFCMSAEKQ